VFEGGLVGVRRAGIVAVVRFGGPDCSLDDLLSPLSLSLSLSSLLPPV
jgi:hypothetical protein